MLEVYVYVSIDYFVSHLYCHVSICKHIHTHMCASHGIYIYLLVYIYICLYIYIYIYIYINTYIHIDIHICISTYL